MDEFQWQLLIAIIVAAVGGGILYVRTKRRYLSHGRSIKNLEYKVAFFFVFPIVTIPVLLTPVIPFWGKVWAAIVGCSVGILKLASLNVARRNFRKVLGLPPEDPDTGGAIEEEDKKNDE